MAGKKNLNNIPRQPTVLCFLRMLGATTQLHARGKYTEDEADSIYRNVRSFIQGLAKMGLSE